MTTPRVLTLTAEGTLLAATDLHGNLRDLEAVVDRFRAAGPTSTLVLCGDLVHGPAIPEGAWPEHLGTFYRDETPALLDRVQALQREFPGRVHCLLGNHEHEHLGGPMLGKFHADEAAFLEQRYGDPDAFGPVRAWVATWPLAAVAPRAGLVLTHAAPHAVIAGAGDLDAVRLDGYEATPTHEMAGAGPLGALLWARTTSSERARAFLDVFGARVAVFGHDPIREGHLVEHEPLLCVSTSFGCHDGDKVYLAWDLAEPATSAAAVAAAGLHRLHPSAEPHYRALS
jgi:hypothetical protein